MSIRITQNPIKSQLGLGEISISMLTVKGSKSDFRLKSEHQLSFGSKRQPEQVASYFTSYQCCIPIIFKKFMSVATNVFRINKLQTK